MNFETIIDSIVSRLSPLTPAVEVIRAAETEADFKRPVSPRVTVSISEMVDARPDTLGSTAVQDVEIKLSLTVQARKLYGSGGLYAIEQAARARVLGFAPASASKVLLESVKFEGLEDNVWTYVATYIVPAKIIETLDAVSEVLCKQIVIIEE